MSLDIEKILSLYELWANTPLADEEIRECLLDARAAISLDRETFAGVGRDTKGHVRALMLIDEMIDETNAAIMSSGKARP